ncbi:hypothetical protein [Arsukibacterium indicum]|uniref:Uncharacterized protein n=1 Tax=Arsukibacterium indicum TaxID=2848612 RepID=A0ABS6MGT2_9GAMM|nr:hypothetical protein [Arsukibacterium indicum]MBV2127960.1 hypothetical protein [Arsukibacterium indicum]
MTELQQKRCPYWDSGWCYAPAGTETNNHNGSCWAPQSCPQQQKLLQEKDTDND